MSYIFYKGLKSFRKQSDVINSVNKQLLENVLFNYFYVRSQFPMDFIVFKNY